MKFQLKKKGSTAIWDFETGKLESILKGDNSDITCIEFLDPYSAIMTATSNGSCFIWGSKVC